MSSTYQPASFSSETFTPDRLHAGELPLAHKKVTLLSGENVTRGTVLGKVTASGKYVTSLSASADGSETPDVIAAQDCDASAADAECLVYTRGDFNANALTIGTGHTASSIEAGLRDKNIYLVTAQSA
jgi:hypothetical protein